MSQMFRAFGSINFRLWFAGGLVSNIGAWMQITAQDWLVLTELTDDDAAAMGLVVALQFAPTLLLLPLTGWLADRIAPKTLLICTQIAMFVLSLALGLLVLSGAAQLWHVFIFAALVGTVMSFDSPPRLTFVTMIVPDKHLHNAISLNGSSWALARLAGPAVAGLLTVLVGPGLVFVLNAFTFVALLACLFLIRPNRRPQVAQEASRGMGGVLAGVKFLGGRPDLITILFLSFVIGAFAMNFTLLIATMTRVDFAEDASVFGILSSVMAIGSLIGAIICARQVKIRVRGVLLASFGFGVTSLLASLAQSLVLFGLALALVGIMAQILTTNTNALIQLRTPAELRGRVSSIYYAVFVGATPIGAPLLGLLAGTAGARWGLVASGVAALVAFSIGLMWLRWRQRRVARMKLSCEQTARSAPTIMLEP